MTPEQKTAVTTAVRVLVESEAADALFESLNSVVSVAVKHPVALTGEAAILNPLLELYRQDFQSYLRLLDLVDTHRAKAGREPLRRQPASDYNKRDYMKEFMAQKRERQRRAVEIENMARSEKDKLVGRARLDFMDMQSKAWLEERDAFLERVRAAHGGGRISKELQAQAIGQFWAAVDRQLDQREQAARYRITNPLGTQLKVDDLSQLMRVLKDDPYKK